MTADEIRAVRPSDGEESYAHFCLQEIAAQLATLNQITEAILVELQRRNGV